MAIKPEEIDPSKLPVALRGYQRDATDELLKRVAWDYRQAVRAQEAWEKDEKRLNERVAELEGQLSTQHEEFANALNARDSRTEEALRKRTAELEEELERLRGELEQLRHGTRENDDREELTRTLLQTAQRAAREMRETAREEADGILKAAQQRAVEIERDAHASVRESASEIDRLQRLEGDLRDQLRQMLEAVIGDNGARADSHAAATEPEPERWSTAPAD